MASDGPREVFFEFIAIGSTVKVVAIDSATGTEVTVIGPAGAAQSDLERLVLAKLKVRLAREAD
jgi:ABC-type protease/lipase transport system fused ATPase/permease subunit